MRWSRNSIKNTQSILKLLLQKIALVNFFFDKREQLQGSWVDKGEQLSGLSGQLCSLIEQLK